MKRLKQKLTGLIFVLGAVVNLNTQAAVITFDDLGPSDYDVISNGYQGFDWSWSAFVNKNLLPDSGLNKGAVSGDYAMLNDFAATATISRAESFDFNGAFFTSAWKDGMQIEAIGYLDNAAVYSQTITTNTSAAQWFDFNFLGITSLSLRSFGGSLNPQSAFDGEQFAMDNFTFNQPAEAPEPSSLLLLGLGLVGMFWGRKTKRKFQNY